MFFSRIRHSRILKKQTVSEAALILVVLSLLSKIVGYLRTVLVAYYFGATAQVDAFVVAMLIPSLVLGIIAGGMQAVIIPVYTEKKKENLKKAKTFVNQIFFINLILLGILSGLMILFPSVFVKIVAYGFSGERLSLASYFLRYLVIFGFFNVFTGLFVGLLQSEKQFLFPAFTLLVGNSLIPLSIFLLAGKIGISSWAAGEIAFGVFTFSSLFLFLFFKKRFFRSFELFRINWHEIFIFFALLLPVILTSGANAIYQIVDKAVVSSLSAGSVAALNFAQLIYRIPYGLIAVPVVISAYPTLSSVAVKKDFSRYIEVVRKTFSLLIFIMFPLSVFFIVYSDTIVNLLYKHGAFTSSAASVTAFAVSMYSIGLIAVSANFLFQRIFFSFKDTKTPFYITLFVVSFNAAGDVLLSKIWGVGGIGLATSLSTIIAFFLYAYLFKKKEFVEDFPFDFIGKEALKTGFVSLVLLVLALFLKPFVRNSSSFFYTLLRFSGVSVLLTVAYLVLARITKLFAFTVFSGYMRKLFRTG